MLPGPYRFDHYRASVVSVATNKVPSAAYRAFGQTQSTFAMERMIDRLARRLDLDPADVRRKNLVADSEMPYRSPAGLLYDSGTYSGALERALEIVGYREWRAKQAAYRQQGRHVGVGICCYVENTGLGPSKDLATMGFRLGGYENVEIALDSRGCATVATGMTSTGQSHATTLAQLCATAIGIPLEDVTVVQGDTDSTPYAPAGCIGSRGAVVGGAAVLLAATALRRKLEQMAAHLLEASADDIEIEQGQGFVRGTPDRAIPVAELAAAIRLGQDIPPGMTPTVVEQYVWEPAEHSYAYATHVAVVEVDIETGGLTYHKYVVVHDCGTVINPSVVEGQILGGVAQGVGGAVLEELVYSGDGQLLTTSFMDYLSPLGTDVPAVQLDHLETPAPHVPGGIKGVGEGGTIAPPAVLANAIEDALAPLGVEAITGTPLDPDTVWDLIRRPERRVRSAGVAD
jgi:carbon-monoxide dehydrogenase large subunit